MTFSIWDTEDLMNFEEPLCPPKKNDRNVKLLGIVDECLYLTLLIWNIEKYARPQSSPESKN